ncbi:MAG TPA: MmcQ/YjbR family DNA-binding protein [Opitutaceae bacterium]
MTPDDFRELSLGAPTAVGGAHMNRRDFRVGGKIFASLGMPDEAWGMVKLNPDQQRSFLARAPAGFNPCSGAWGRAGCTNVLLAKATKAVVKDAMTPAARNILLRPKKPRRLEIS